MIKQDPVRYKGQDLFYCQKKLRGVSERKNGNAAILWRKQTKSQHCDAIIPPRFTPMQHNPSMREAVIS